MSEVVASEGLPRRSGLIAVLLAFFLPVVGFAYVRRLAFGLAFVLLSPVIVLVGGRLGVPTTIPGFYAMTSVAVAVLIASLAYAWWLARNTPVGATRRWYNRWYHYAWLAVASVVLGNWLFFDWAIANRARVFGYESYRMPSMSMQPTLRPGDFVTADARARSLAELHRGDIVTYVPSEKPNEVWAARIVGMPGESVATRGNRVSIDGKPLAESYANVIDPVPQEMIPHPNARLADDEYFLMGDNRSHALDSRFQGPIRRAALRSKITAIWLHWSPYTHSLDTSRIGPVAAAPSP